MSNCLVTGRELKKYIKRTLEPEHLVQDVCINGSNVLWVMNRKGESLVLHILSSVKQVTSAVLRDITQQLDYGSYAAWVSNIAELNTILDRY